MEMHQGQMCKLKRRSDGASIGLYLRLRATDGNQRYYRVPGGVMGDEEMDDQMIAFSDVDQSYGVKIEMRERPYVISCIVPTELQVKALLVNPNIDIGADVAKAAILSDIKREIDANSREIGHVKNQMRQYEALQAQADTLEAMQDELQKIIDDVNAGKSVSFTYVYGVHPSSPKEFCWRVPADLVDRVRVGLEAVGDTQFGPKEFTITRIERMERLLPHRRMLSVEDLNLCQEL